MHKIIQYFKQMNSVYKKYFFVKLSMFMIANKVELLYHCVLVRIYLKFWIPFNISNNKSDLIFAIVIQWFRIFLKKSSCRIKNDS